MALEFPVESGGNDPVATAPRFCSGVVSSGGNDFEAALFSVFTHSLSLLGSVVEWRRTALCAK